MILIVVNINKMVEETVVECSRFFETPLMFDMMHETKLQETDNVSATSGDR